MSRGRGRSLPAAVPFSEPNASSAMLKEDLARTWTMLRPRHSRPGAAFEFLCTPGVHAVVVFRFAHWLIGRPLLLRVFLEPLRVLLYNWVRTAWGIQIGRTARIGPGFYVGHFGGILVGRDVVIGKNACISQGVTIGLGGRGERYGAPVIGDDVYIAPGAKLFGKIRIGDNVSIGANAVVYKDIPDHAVVAAAPGYKILYFKNERPA